jgi:hypothetical protein
MLKLWTRFIGRALYPQVTLWRLKGYKTPYPARLKQRFLTEEGYKNATWVETGTYLGETTKALSKNSYKVYSIEPQIDFFTFANKRFKTKPKIAIINDTSENALQDIVSMVQGKVNFFLDGHYSGGATFDSGNAPVLIELSLIEKFLPGDVNFKIFIDDFRLFQSANTGDKLYPSRRSLVDWAEDRKLDWTIEKDIFCIWNENKR